jgi:tocopherol cyclase
MATNHFTDPSLSLSGSIAIIPWRRSSFRGFLLGVRSDAGLTVFATHAGSRVEHLGITHDQVDWTLCSRDGHRLELSCTRARGGLLAAPVRTEMHHRVEETIDAQVRMRLWSPQRQLLIDDTGLAAGLEVYGNLDALLAMT